MFDRGVVAARGSGAGEEDREGDGDREDRAKPFLAAGVRVAAGREREGERSMERVGA